MTGKTVWPDTLFTDLDRTGPVPLYFQVASRLEQAITGGHINPGDRLEDEISIGKRLGLSRPTVRRAIQDLVDKGLLVRRRGVGTQVVQDRVSRAVELTSLQEDLERTGHTPSTQVLSNEVVAASAEIARSLGIKTGDPITRIRRVRFSDNSPVAVLLNYLPETAGEFNSEDFESRGLYDLLRARGFTIKVANQTIGARRTQNDEHTLLEIPKGAPVLTMDRVAFDISGNAIEVGMHCYRSDRYRFETTLVAR
ncbi:MAG: GntR family transcriptional regulator [Canibacter sp.]